MLTRELAINAVASDQVVPDRLLRGKHDAYTGYAAAMLRIFSEGVGKTRQELRIAVRRVFDNEPDCDPRRIDALCKLLEDPPISKFVTDRRGKAAELRCRVFALAAPHHPLVTVRDQLFESEEQPIKEDIARQLGRPSWAALEPELFADVFEYNTLQEFRGFPSPEALLARYNVAQVQAALFDAISLTVRARANLKEILTRAKLARLLHTVTAPPSGEKNGYYTFQFDGPASIHEQTRRYGADMARFLPSLIACEDWTMRAEIHRGRSHRRYFLDLKAGHLHADHEIEQFDSEFEEKFFGKWGAEPRDGWTIKREADVLHQGQTAFIPDFSFQHEDGRRVFFEIAAYWTPEYVQTKSAKINLFPGAPLLLAMPERYAKKWSEVPRHVLLFKSALKINAVVEALDRVAPALPLRAQCEETGNGVAIDPNMDAMPAAGGTHPSDFVAYVDESGCKLKAGTTPPDGSDLGVAVAVVLPQTETDSFVTAIRDRLPSPLTEDSHVTDWDADAQRAAREAVFSAVKDRRPRILYEAVTAEGFHRSQHLVPEEAKRLAKAAVRGTVKVNASHDNPQSHAELLANVMSKVRALVSDLATEDGRDPTADRIAFLVDQVDTPILEEAKALMAEIDSADSPSVVRVKGFDTSKKAVVEGAIISSVQGMDALPLPQYTVEVRPKSDHGIFAADVIANALYKHLRDDVAMQGRQIRVNQPEAVEGFALCDFITGFSDSDASDVLFGFRHEDAGRKGRAADAGSPSS